MNLRHISVTDNFFDLGGHSLLAIRVAALVKRRLRRTLPLSALVHGASVESLARLLRETKEFKPETPLVAIQPEGGKRPFFCIHPIGGNVLCYVEVARFMGTDWPFFGLQSVDQRVESHSYPTIEGMAARYIETIREVQPRGPYLLGGWSFGGVVAFEMARQVERNGDEVAALVLLDTWAPAGQTATSRFAPRAADLLARFLADLAGVSGQKLSVDIDLDQLDREAQLRFTLEQAMNLNILPPGIDCPQLAAMFDIFEANARAFYDYAPAPGESGSPIILFRASEGKDPLLDGPTLGWDRILEDPPEVHAVPGDHYTMLATVNAVNIARQLKTCLDSLSN